MTDRRSTFTSEGTFSGSFTPSEWGLVAVMALSWGSSFALIAEALESFGPATITFGRVFFGFLVVAAHPRARQKVAPEDWPRIIVLGVIWMAVPLTLYGYAEQRIDSAVAGMITGGTPLLIGLIASFFLRRLPGRRQMIGLAIGFTGILAISSPELADSRSSALGALMIVGAITCYGFATNLAVPVQQRYGSIPILARMQVVAMATTLPVALLTRSDAQIAASSALALLPLGMAGTGLAYVAMATLSGRVGATRASIGVNIVPVVAAVVGLVFRSDSIAPAAWAGMVLVIGGAWMVSRAEELTG